MVKQRVGPTQPLSLLAHVRVPLSGSRFAFGFVLSFQKGSKLVGRVIRPPRFLPNFFGGIRRLAGFCTGLFFLKEKQWDDLNN